MIYVIGCDLAAPERNEGAIGEWLESSFRYSRSPLPRFWIVEGALAAEQIRNGLAPLLGPHDRLVIVKGATEAIWHGVPEADARWLAEHFPGSITERIPGVSEGLTAD
jgi:hypothetical protein